MSEPTTVNAQVVDSLSVTKDATLTPEIVRIEGAGKAYQSVAQSMAIAAQDATDYLRNVNTISTTAQGVAMAQLLETKDSFYAEALAKAQEMAAQAADVFKTVGTNASDVLKGFPSD